ncbi:DUF3987 domain-containing protein [Reichenbachiella sp. MALMAid0571]|uniref:DUF3987 domain-containing protein n=1 Tax=Reichenbachiella sp. MALMAid0571 TaxID=3143939 RepID=UPI0032DFF514
MSTLEQILAEQKNKLATASNGELNEELNKRERSNLIFPLDAFHPKIKPFIEVLVNEFDIPRSFIGLCLLSVYSTSIGASYRVVSKIGNPISLAIWACMEGISSSGKSYAIDVISDPLYQIQKLYDQEWENGQEAEERVNQELKTVVYRDSHISTLVRYVMPDNPKGVVKHSDEIMEWLNGMNQLSRKEGTDEQFWLSTWSGRAYSGIRSRKDKFVLPSPFVNVIGGIQPTITYKLFAKDRDTTGFIFRLLFAVPEEVRVASPNLNYTMPDELMKIHAKCIHSLYTGLPVYESYEEPKICKLDSNAIREFNEWIKIKTHKINRMEDIRDKEIHSGVLGKVKEYALRFSAILTLVDRTFEHQDYDDEVNVPQHVMNRALRMADYFYESAIAVYDRVNTTMTAPVEVLRVAAMMRLGYSQYKITEIEYNGSKERADYLKMNRKIKKWIKDYPKVFNAVPK